MERSLRGQLTDSGLYMGMSLTVLFSLFLIVELFRDKSVGISSDFICHILELKPVSQTRTSSYLSATDVGPCKSSNATKKGMGILVKQLGFNHSSYCKYRLCSSDTQLRSYAPINTH